MTTQDIESTANPRVKRWASLATRAERDRTNTFLIEGRRETERAISSLNITEIIWFPEYGAAPDPFALAELSTDVRPPDYATSFARLLLTQSPLEVPLVVTAKNRTAWLDAVVSEPGVISEPLIEAVARFS